MQKFHWSFQVTVIEMKKRETIPISPFNTQKSLHILQMIRYSNPKRICSWLPYVCDFTQELPSCCSRTTVLWIRWCGTEIKVRDSLVDINRPSDRSSFISPKKLIWDFFYHSLLMKKTQVHSYIDWANFLMKTLNKVKFEQKLLKSLLMNTTRRLPDFFWSKVVFKGWILNKNCCLMLPYSLCCFSNLWRACFAVKYQTVSIYSTEMRHGILTTWDDTPFRSNLMSSYPGGEIFHLKMPIKLIWLRTKATCIKDEEGRKKTSRLDLSSMKQEILFFALRNANLTWNEIFHTVTALTQTLLASINYRVRQCKTLSLLRIKNYSLF